MLHGLIAIALVAGSFGMQRTRERISTFGGVELVEIDRRPSSDAMPVLHGPDRSRELLLRWRAPDALGEVSLSDDGTTLRVVVEGRDCAALTNAAGYEDRLGQPALRGMMRERLREWLRTCPRITKAEAQAVRAGFIKVENDLVAGTQAMRRRAQHWFGPTLERCRPVLASKTSGAIVAPDVFARC